MAWWYSGYPCCLTALAPVFESCPGTCLLLAPCYHGASPEHPGRNVGTRRTCPHNVQFGFIHPPTPNKLLHYTTLHDTGTEYGWIPGWIQRDSPSSLLYLGTVHSIYCIDKIKSIFLRFRPCLCISVFSFPKYNSSIFCVTYVVQGPSDLEIFTGSTGLEASEYP